MNNWLTLLACTALSFTPLFANDPAAPPTLDEVIADLQAEDSGSTDQDPKKRQYSRTVWTLGSDGNPVIAETDDATREALRRFLEDDRFSGIQARDLATWFYDGADDPLLSGSSQFGISVTNDSNGAFTVKVNGKEVDESRLRRKGDDVEVLDESGKVIFKFKNKESGAIGVPRGSTGYFQLENAPAAVKRPLIGINMDPVSEALSYHLELAEGSGVMITHVHENMSAEKAGLRKFDVVVSIDGDRNVTMDSLRAAVTENAGGKVVLSVLRRGQRLVLEIPVEEREFNSTDTTWRYPWAGPGEQGKEFDLLSSSLNAWQPLIDNQDRLLYDRFDRYGKAVEMGKDVAAGEPAASTTEAMRRLEERLERLEKMIERIEKRF